jgi:hypothetical protein
VQSCFLIGNRRFLSSRPFPTRGNGQADDGSRRHRRHPETTNTPRANEITICVTGGARCHHDDARRS